MRLKILLVDDNPTFLAAVKQFLQMLPDTQVVGAAQSGGQALQLAQQLQPDLVLLDIVMPGLSGLDVAQTMLDWDAPPKILFLTMHSNASYRAAAEAFGVFGLVDKANLVTDLLPIINTLINSLTNAAGVSKVRHPDPHQERAG